MSDVKDLAYQDYLTGMKYKDIAEKHGVSIDTVKNWKRRYWSKDGDTKKSVKVDTKNVTPKGKVSTEPLHGWLEIENEYVTDISKKPCTLKDLANKYVIPLQTIYDYSATHEWSVKRKEYKENTKKIARETTSMIIGCDVGEVTARHFKLSDKVLSEIEKALSDENELYKYVEVLRKGYGSGEFDDTLTTETLTALNDKKLLNIVNSLEKLQKMQRITSGALTPIEQHKIEYDNARLSLEKKKAETNPEDGKPIEILIKKVTNDEGK